MSAEDLETASVSYESRAARETRWVAICCVAGFLALAACTQSTPPPDAPAAPAASSATDPTPASSSERVTERTSGGDPAAAASANSAQQTSGRIAERESAGVPPVPAAEIEVKNIGLHIGGGPNDAKTKAPFVGSIEGHFDAFGRCYADAGIEEVVTVSVDLLVVKSGGNPEVGEIRTGVKIEAFVECVRRVFASVAFEPPKLGATRFSYSIRLAQKRQ